MSKFNIGDTVIFVDRGYTIDYPPAGKFMNKEGTVLSQRDYEYGFLIKVQFANGILEAYEKRFTLVESTGKTAIEIKVKTLYERQPYYKTLKV